MNRRVGWLGMGLMSMLLSSCGIIGFITSSGDSSSASKPAPTPISHVSIEPGKGYEVASINQTYHDLGEKHLYGLANAPASGDLKLLVIPVWFSDSSTFIQKNKREQVREDIRLAYFGDEADTGWHSVSSFYFEESFGALSISGTVSSWYEIGQSYLSYAPNSSGGSATIALVNKAADWYFAQNPGESRTDYDNDGNGWLDGVMLIYAAPDYAALIGSEDPNYKNLWAYCYWADLDEKRRDTRSPGANTFFWASYDFLYSSFKALSRTGSSYATGDTRYCSIDAHTYIHEMGHVLGLDDYYDYGPYKYAPAGGFSMQDHNVGGHDPFSVMALGWAEPYVPSEPCTIKLRPFQDSHEIILLSPRWNDAGSVFDEYLLLELYTPTGLNEFDHRHSYSGSSTVGPSEAGIRLWHVDARLAHCEKVSGGYPVFTEDLTYDLESESRYGFIPAFTDSYANASYCGPFGTKFEDLNLLQLIHNNTLQPLHSSKTIANNSLFGDGSSFTLQNYGRQFVNSDCLNSGEFLGWSFHVSLEGSGDDTVASVEIFYE